jgi:hypothetical protein
MLSNITVKAVPACGLHLTLRDKAQRPLPPTLDLMKIITARFDEIEHVHRIEANGALPRHTIFSFVQDLKYTPYVTVPGFPRLEAGMRVTAVLREEGNWKSLVGWHDLDTGDVVVPSSSWHARRVFFFLAWGALLALFGWPKQISRAESLLIPIGAGIFALSLAAFETKKLLQTKQDAEKVRVLVSGANAA